MVQRRRLRDHKDTVVDAPFKLNTLGNLVLEADYYVEEEHVVVWVKAPSKASNCAHNSRMIAASNHKALLLLSVFA